MNDYEANGAKKTIIEDESKFFVEDIESLTTEIQKITGEYCAVQTMTDTYFSEKNLPKNSTLRIREANGSCIPTLKIPMYDKRELKKRLEVESLEEISMNLGINLNSVRDIEDYFTKELIIKQERNIIEYLGVECSIDKVLYFNLNNEFFYQALIFEAELKNQQGIITRNGIINHLKDKKLLKAPCKLDKYRLGLKHMNEKQ